MGVNVGATIKVGWGVAVGRAVGGGGASTGMEQPASTIMIRTGKNNLIFIHDAPFLI
jgi:hypothetical protein